MNEREKFLLRFRPQSQAQEDPRHQKVNEARELVSSERSTAFFALVKLVERIESQLSAPSSNIDALKQKLQGFSDKKLFDLWRIASSKSEMRAFFEKVANEKCAKNPDSLIRYFIDHHKFKEDPVSFVEETLEGSKLDISKSEETFRRLTKEQMLKAWLNASEGGNAREMIEKVADTWRDRYRSPQLRNEIDKLKSEE